MASPSVTYTFANSTTADATQVNQNFTDLINGVTDGTKDLSISAFTCAGTATLNGHVNLGNASADDLTITASLASTIGIKTTNSFDIGSSTLGLRSLYLADAGSAGRTTRVLGATIASSYTLTLPTSAGTAGYNTVNLGTGTLAFLPPAMVPVVNYSLATSVATNALTVALKGADGNDPSATNPVYISFRSATAATGTPVLRTVSAATSVVVPASTTLGSVSATATYYYIYAIDNAGTVELAISIFGGAEEGSTLNTTAISGGASNVTLYSTTARTGVAIRLIGRISATEATAGTWATAPSEISILPFPKPWARSSCAIYGAIGLGSGNTRIRRYTAANVVTVGSDITYTSSSANGDSFTINRYGVYTMHASDYSTSGADYFGFSLNSNQLSTDITSITAANILNVSQSISAGAMNIAWTAELFPGDVVRVHVETTSWVTSNSIAQRFGIVRVG